MTNSIMIIGAGGFLGSRLFEYFSKREGCQVIGVTHEELDITDSLAVSAFIGAVAPDVVLHCAAISNTACCEENPALSESVNVYGTDNVAKACRKAGSGMVFMSSDQVYTASHLAGPNREGSEGRPRGVYGRDKKRAEEAMLSQLPEGLALRLTWMYDYPGNGRVPGNNLLGNIMKALKTGNSLPCPVNDHRGITYVWDVIRNMEKAMELPGGIYNFGSPNELNSYETGAAFAKILTGRENIDAIVRPDLERFRGCPRNLTIDIKKLEEGGIYFENTLQGFYRCLKDHGWEAGGRLRLGSCG